MGFKRLRCLDHEKERIGVVGTSWRPFPGERIDRLGHIVGPAALRGLKPTGHDRFQVLLSAILDHPSRQAIHAGTIRPVAPVIGDLVAVMRERGIRDRDRWQRILGPEVIRTLDVSLVDSIEVRIGDYALGEQMRDVNGAIPAQVAAGIHVIEELVVLIPALCVNGASKLLGLG